VIEAPGISVILLAFNEAENLPSMMDETLQFLRSNLKDWEVVIVDDGSTDGTLQIAKEKARSDGRIKVVSHGNNRGMGAGMRSGITASTQPYFTIIAGDGQHPAFELERMIPGLAEADIVTTFHENQREWSRRFLSWGFRQMMKQACNIDFVLEGIYLFPRTVAVDEIGLDSIHSQTFFFSFELITHAMKRGYKVAVRPMVVRRREHGDSKVVSTARIRRIFGEIMDFRRRLKATH